MSIDGIIPAYAGNTCPAIRKHSPTRNHPRVCGEHALSTVLSTSSAGSSPRMRGTPTCADYEIPWRGIIPAYAGNTSGYPSARPYARDHPRVCGEHLISCTFPRNASGSSPRMRGTRRFRKASTPNNGIIPAYAGNTNSKQIKPPQYKDHPRVCGEHSASCMVRWLPRGSSPRMRGTRLATRPKTRSDGIIPAYAGNTRATAARPQPTRDHPRVCGEHTTMATWFMPLPGSSPRMRGTPHELRDGRVIDGIIPAYAGNTWNRQRQASPCWDHPRVCGEHAVLNSDALPFTGSSPRMRGTLLHHALALASGGIIPAYAGNTCETCEGSSDGGDHPRVCGEHGCNLYHRGGLPGSSPRMRGTHDVPWHNRRYGGIIPAYAGNTPRPDPWTGFPGDHPRVCGEHQSSVVNRIVNGGSSPRMRGTQVRRAFAGAPPGIIPAYAGNTLRGRSRPQPAGDHPRVCGEHCRWSAVPCPNPGSSPRMRGTHRWRMLSRSHCGIIPAYAGNTSANSSSASTKRDHPRVCGEHFSEQFERINKTGSSPRMRGTRMISSDFLTYHGIIPAYAGNTRLPCSYRRLEWDHPRVCGEHTAVGDAVISAKGSSPRMRGTHHGITVRGAEPGIIPAYAGNTGGTRANGWIARDHPRVCGEHPPPMMMIATLSGSSPRMRGTLQSVVFVSST